MSDAVPDSSDKPRQESKGLGHHLGYGVKLLGFLGWTAAGAIVNQLRDYADIALDVTSIKRLPDGLPDKAARADAWRARYTEKFLAPDSMFQPNQKPEQPIETLTFKQFVQMLTEPLKSPGPKKRQENSARDDTGRVSEEGTRPLTPDIKNQVRDLGVPENMTQSMMTSNLVSGSKGIHRSDRFR